MTTRSTTQDLIAQLAGCPPPARLSAAGAVACLLAAVGLAVGLFLLLAGPRGDLVQALGRPEVVLKLALPLAVALLALPLALRSARPVATVPLRLLAVPATAALILFLWQMARTHPSQVVPGILGDSGLACLVSITLLALPATVLVLALFRRGASLRAGMTGGLVGLAASAGAATGYALHCTEDSPLFFTTWYGIAILTGGAMGAWLGHRMLRW